MVKDVERGDNTPMVTGWPFSILVVSLQWQTLLQARDTALISGNGTHSGW